MRFFTRVLTMTAAAASLALSAGCIPVSGVVVVLPETKDAKRFVLPKITFQAGKDSYWLFTNLHVGERAQTDRVRVVLSDDVVERTGLIRCLPDKYTKQRHALTAPLVVAEGAPAAAAAPATEVAESPVIEAESSAPKCSVANPPYSFTLDVLRAVRVGSGANELFTPGVCVAAVKLKRQAASVKQVDFRVCIGEREVADPKIIIRGGD
jgi:hypothetical protein